MKMKASVLIVDDDNDLLESAELLLSKDYRVKVANSVELAKAILLQNTFDVVVVDLCFEGQDEDGISLLNFVRSRVPDVEVVVLSGDHMTSRIVEAMKRSLVDFIPKSGDYSETLKLAVARGLEKKRQKAQRSSDVSFLTSSPKMKSIIATAQKVAEAPGKFSILINGETGTGKEVLAKYLSALMRKPFVGANMASVPRDTAESELFGHMKGSFTGAIANKAGLIEQAHGGIFFLDEIGDCSLQLQAKLLRVLQEREIQPVGGRTRKVDVRFFAATNRDLETMVGAGTFRLDLLQRINTFRFIIPPLRERPEDVVLYTNQFLTEFTGNNVFTLTSCGIAALLDYSWPGNVRELRNIIERMVLLTDRQTIDGELVYSSLATPNQKITKIESEPGRAKILSALENENGNRTRAARRLNVHISTLYRWIAKYGISTAFAGQPGRPSLLREAAETRTREVNV
jgi:DNA-binding NtrC family response regulator